DRGGPSLHLARVEQSGQGVGQVVKDSCATFQVALAALPRHPDCARCFERITPENVWVSPDQLLVHAPCNLLQAQLALLRQEKGKEVHLEEEITELVGELRVVARNRSVRDLVGLLDGVRNDCSFRLFPIPGAVATESLGQRLELDERLGETHLLGSRRRGRSACTR